MVTLGIKGLMLVDKCYISDYFTNISNFHLGPCTCAFLVAGQGASCMVFIFSSRLPAQPFGLVASCLRPPFESWCFQYGWYLPISDFLFYKVRHTAPWPSGKVSITLLHSWGFHFDCLCPTFLEEAPKFLANLITISGWSGLPVPSNLLIDIRYCRWVAVIIWPLLSSCGILGSFSYRASPLKVSPKFFRGTASLLSEISWEILFLPSIILILWQRRYQCDVFPSLRRAIVCIPIWSFTIEEDRIK